MKFFVIILLSAGTTVAQTAPAPFATWAAKNPATHLTAATFSHPPVYDHPWVRINTPPELSNEELRSEILEMKRDGIGGLELGQGTFPRTEQLVTILKAANEAGLKVSLSHGTVYTPNGYTLESANARKSLLFTNTKVDASGTADITFKAPLPPAPRGFGGGGRGPAGPGGAPPAAPPQPPRRSAIQAVFAYKCANATCEANGPIELDPNSAIDLTSKITATDKAGLAGGTSTGKLNWTAPAGGQWQVIALWSQGYLAQPDVYSKAGTDDLIHGMEADWTPEVRSLIRQNGGDLFYDSHSTDRGSPTDTWTNNMEAEFKTRRGYSLLQFAPSLFPANFTFSDGSAARVRNDFNGVRGDMWIEYHLKPLTAWAHTYNLRLRLQPYGEIGTTPDEIMAAAILDRPETESLFFGDEIDSFLPIASANHMTGNTWYSTECCAALNKAYAQTFQDAVIRMHREYAAGVTRLVYHVYPYRDAAGSKWPGYHSFGNAGFSNAWGPRNPFWIDANTYNDYFARTQQVLTQGDARIDVAVYMQSYLFPQPQQSKPAFHIWADPALQRAGFTRDYLDPALLALPAATVSANHLAAGKANYKALIIDSELKPASDPVKTAMPLDAAQHILTFAKAGLPIIIVGDAPGTTPGRTPADDAKLQDLMRQLTALKNVYTVAHEADVPAKLRALNIHPAAEPTMPSPLRTLRRHDNAKNTDFYFLYNEVEISPANEPANLFEPSQGKSFEGDIHLLGAGKPYLMDAWTGAITPISSFTPGKGGVTLHLTLAPDDAAIIALSPTPMGNGKPISYTATSSAPIDLTHNHWHLSVEDWRPAHPFGTTGVQASETSRNTLEMDLTELKPWAQIPQLKDASGVATYTATVDLPTSWKPGSQASISLGEVMDSFVLSINGKGVPINQISAAAEVGPYLKPGRNTIGIRVATTLNNRLSQLDPEVAKRNFIQNYGLIGPTQIIPHN